jgi:hypothetical protein
MVQDDMPIIISRSYIYTYSCTIYTTFGFINFHTYKNCKIDKKRSLFLGIGTHEDSRKI